MLASHPSKGPGLLDRLWMIPFWFVISFSSLAMPILAQEDLDDNNTMKNNSPSMAPSSIRYPSGWSSQTATTGSVDFLVAAFFLIAAGWLILALMYSILVLIVVRLRARGELDIYDEQFGRLYLLGNRCYIPLGCILRRYVVALHAQHQPQQQQHSGYQHQVRFMTRDERRRAMQELLVSDIITRAEEVEEEEGREQLEATTTTLGEPDDGIASYEVDLTQEDSVTTNDGPVGEGISSSSIADNKHSDTEEKEPETQTKDIESASQGDTELPANLQGGKSDSVEELLMQAPESALGGDEETGSVKDTANGSESKVVLDGAPAPEPNTGDHWFSDASDQDEPMCSICLMEYESSDVRHVATTCRHEFHRSCLLDWLERRANTECPCCRVAMVSEDRVWEVVERHRLEARSKARRNRRSKGFLAWFARGCCRPVSRQQQHLSLSEVDDMQEREEGRSVVHTQPGFEASIEMATTADLEHVDMQAPVVEATDSENVCTETEIDQDEPTNEPQPTPIP